VSCDYPTQLPWDVGTWSPWKVLAQPAAAGEIDVMLHLGDQVYTWENQRMPAALRVMDLSRAPTVTARVRAKMSARASSKLQEAYRHAWGQPWCARALSHSSHLMVWSDNDVTNDFTIAFEPDGTQTYPPDYLRVATRVYQLYQKQLRAPGCVAHPLSPNVAAKDESPAPLREWVQQVYGAPLREWVQQVYGGWCAEWVQQVYGAPLREWVQQVYGGWCAVFLIDMRGNHIDEAGVLRRDQPTLAPAQRVALSTVFDSPGVRCIIIGAEIPFVGPTPEGCREQAAKLPFLREHWPYLLDELLWLLDLCFEWKAASAGREVLLLAGDIHVGVTSEIHDAKTGLTIQHLTTSPITNNVSAFFNPLEGKLSERYSYTHTVLDGLHNYAQVDVALANDGESVSLQAQLVGIPLPTPAVAKA
jgi:hypothetical protein